MKTEERFSLKVKRTNVRINDIRRLIDARRILPALFPFLSRISSSLASRWAETMFFTPARHVPPSEEKDFLRKGKRATVFFRSRRVVTWTFGDPSRPMVLLVHGWA